ncbi:N-acetylglucosamine-6-phosphate deacetylase-like [Saccoglossus kowalevskii]
MPSNESVSQSRILQFHNCYLLFGHNLIKEDLWVREGKILNPRKLFWDEKGYADVKINCNGMILSPGLIDVQINGGLGYDFSSEHEKLEKGLSEIAKYLLTHGITSFCPTVISSEKLFYPKILPKIKKTKGGKEGAGILGIHAEGPFINVQKRGAHLADHIISAGFPGGFQDALDVYTKDGFENIVICTLAPELENASTVVKEMTQRNIRVSVGHSMANLSQAEEAVKHGATFITHLFNAMLPFHHRDPGIVGLLTSDQIPKGQQIYYGIIADGIHTNPAALRIAHRAHPKGLVLISDAIAAMGLPVGQHHLSDQLIEVCSVDDNPDVPYKATIAGTQTLCGSVGVLDACVRHFKEASGCSKVKL